MQTMKHRIPHSASMLVVNFHILLYIPSKFKCLPQAIVLPQLPIALFVGLLILRALCIPYSRHWGFARFKKAKSALRFFKSAKNRATKDQKARKKAVPC